LILNDLQLVDSLLLGDLETLGGLQKLVRGPPATC
jgi:hypothetical protein